MCNYFNLIKFITTSVEKKNIVLGNSRLQNRFWNKRFIILFLLIYKKTTLYSHFVFFFFCRRITKGTFCTLSCFNFKQKYLTSLLALWKSKYTSQWIYFLANFIVNKRKCTVICIFWEPLSRECVVFSNWSL